MVVGGRTALGTAKGDPSASTNTVRLQTQNGTAYGITERLLIHGR